MNKSYYFVLFGSLAWCIAIILTPLLNSNLSYFFFSHVCHQLPERSLFLMGRQLPVCARCFGIYFSWTIGIIIWAIRKVKVSKQVLLLATIPLALDALTQLTGLRESTNLLRVLTGLLFGLTLALFILRDLINLISDRKTYIK